MKQKVCGSLPCIGKGTEYMGDKRRTASYKIIAKDGGRRYRFFCDASGMAMVTTGPYRCDDMEEELDKAWQKEGREQFNLCHQCHVQCGCPALCGLHTMGEQTEILFPLRSKVWDHRYFLPKVRSETAVQGGNG